MMKWNTPKDSQKLDGMQRTWTLRNSGTNEKKVIEIHQLGKSFKALGLQQVGVRDVILKWRKHGSVVKLPRSGWLTKATPRAQWWLPEDPTTTFKELQVCLASVKVRGHAFTIRKTLGWVAEFQGENPCWAKRTLRLLSNSPEHVLTIPKTFRKTFWLDKGLTLCECDYIWCKITLYPIKTS